VRRRTVATVVACIVSVAGCKDRGPNLELGPPSKFRLALVNDALDIGIDLELRAPAGYEQSSIMPFDEDWFRRNDPVITVSTNPEEEVTFEQPCGDPAVHGFGTPVVVSRIDRPDDLTVMCEKQQDTMPAALRVVRLIRSIDTVIECRVTMGADQLSSAHRAGGLAICGSLRVLGRSTWTNDDDAPRVGKRPK
jgi:hypothetical protein